MSTPSKYSVDDLVVVNRQLPPFFISGDPVAIAEIRLIANGGLRYRVLDPGDASRTAWADQDDLDPPLTAPFWLGEEATPR